MHEWIWKKNRMERDYLGDTGVDGRMIIQWILKGEDGRVYNGLIWLVATISGWLL
jgi:hypothetical protein